MNMKNTMTEKEYGQPPEPERSDAARAGRLMWVIRVTALLLAAAGLFLTGRFLLNERFLSDYRSGRYADTYERPLLTPNLPESWLPLYNLGNVSYQQEDYDAAVGWYQQSLEKNPPEEEKECAVRINLALALLHKVDYEHLDTEKAVSTAVQQLLQARGILTEHGCADPEGTEGHSPEAEQLKKEIDEFLKKLQNPDSSQDQEEQNDGQEQEEKQQQEQQDDRQESNREKHIREELEQQRQQSAKERANAQQELGRQQDGSGSGEFDGKTW